MEPTSPGRTAYPTSSDILDHRSEEDKRARRGWLSTCRFQAHWCPDQRISRRRTGDRSIRGRPSEDFEGGLVCRTSGDGVGLAQRRGLRMADYPVQGDFIGRGHGGYEAVVESDASLPKRTAVAGGAGTSIVPVAAGGRAGVACCPSLGVGSASSAVFSSRSRPGG